MGRVRTFVSDEAALAWSGRAKLVRAKGLEPTHSLEYQDLNLARLPVPPRPLGRRSAASITGLPGRASALAPRRGIGQQAISPRRPSGESHALPPLRVQRPPRLRNLARV